MPSAIDKMKLTRKHDRRARFTDEQVKKMRKMYANGHTQKAIAELFGTCQSTVSYIVSEKARQHLAEYKKQNPSIRRTKEESMQYQKSLRQYKFDIFGDSEEFKTKSKTVKQKRNWEERFQRWSNKIFQDGTTPYGKCGYGSMCDYCEDNSYGKPCVRALNEMCREKNIKIDYEHRSYEDAWNGVFK